MQKAIVKPIREKWCEITQVVLMIFFKDGENLVFILECVCVCVCLVRDDGVIDAVSCKGTLWQLLSVFRRLLAC